MTRRYPDSKSKFPEIYRNGPDHRQGQECNFSLIRKRFDFRSVEIGRWVTRAEQQRAAEHFYDAFCDLMMILQVPELVVSLRGTLALQYGTGGRLGVSAHYSPGQRAFALAKNAGPGSIAHEWFHALDHYLADKAFTSADRTSFASGLWLEQGAGNQHLISHPLNQKLSHCFACIILDESGEQPSILFQRSLTIDKALGQSYYSQPEELCARAFEAFVQDAGLKNNFLVKGTKASKEAEYGLYPAGQQRQRINTAFSDYFQHLGLALARTVD